jgi:hypothetical protein
MTDRELDAVLARVAVAYGRSIMACERFGLTEVRTAARRRQADRLGAHELQIHRLVEGRDVCTGLALRASTRF